MGREADRPDSLGINPEVESEWRNKAHRSLLRWHSHCPHRRPLSPAGLCSDFTSPEDPAALPPFCSPDCACLAGHGLYLATFVFSVCRPPWTMRPVMGKHRFSFFPPGPQGLAQRLEYL